MLRRIISTAFAAVLLFASAANLDLPVKTVGGKTYYYYRVRPSETLFSLSRKLGVTQEDIVKFNPAVADGLKANTTLYFPTQYFDSLEPAPAPASATTSKVSLDQEQQQNVDATERNEEIQRRIAEMKKKEEELRQNEEEMKRRAEESHNEIDRIRHHRDRTKSVTADQPETENRASSAKSRPSTITHVIQKGETLFGLAYRNGTTVDAIIAANPGLDSKYYQAGRTIVIPVNTDSEDYGSEDIASVDEAASTPSVTVTLPDSNGNVGVYENDDDELVAEVEETPDTLVITVMLPFELAEAEQSKTTQRYMEFYRGFLLAADSLSHNGDPVMIRAIDTSVPPDALASLLRTPAMEEVDVFVGPEDADQLQAIAETARTNDSRLFNIFAVRDDRYLSNPAVIQANIPHTDMYSRAIAHFLSAYPASEVTPVFISRIDGAADKIAFTDSLRAHLKADGRFYKEINFHGVLTRDDLSSLSPSESYVFIPVTGQRSEFTKFAPALREFRDESPATSPVRLFGYPEWVTFRGDTYDLLCDLNSTIYARYYTDPDDYRARRVSQSFDRWFDTPMADAFPSQGLLGFDVATFLIRALRDNQGDFSEPATPYSGIQCDFRLISPLPVAEDAEPTAGLVNNALYIINFRPGGIVDRITL